MCEDSGRRTGGLADWLAAWRFGVLFFLFGACGMKACNGSGFGVRGNFHHREHETCGYFDKLGTPRGLSRIRDREQVDQPFRYHRRPCDFEMLAATHL